MNPDALKAHMNNIGYPMLFGLSIIAIVGAGLWRSDARDRQAKADCAQWGGQVIEANGKQVCAHLTIKSENKK